MNCKNCGRTLRETYGVHYLNEKWMLVRALYCPYHGSFVTSADLAEGIEVEPDPTVRDHIRPGLHVLIYLKADQKYQKPTEGFVGSILTKSFIHSRGIKVRLTNGQVGRVQKILK